jgi:hypothetical protein
VQALKLAAWSGVICIHSNLRNERQQKGRHSGGRKSLGLRAYRPKWRAPRSLKESGFLT